MTKAWDVIPKKKSESAQWFYYVGTAKTWKEARKIASERTGLSESKFYVRRHHRKKR